MDKKFITHSLKTIALLDYELASDCVNPLVDWIIQSNEKEKKEIETELWGEIKKLQKKIIDLEKRLAQKQDAINSQYREFEKILFTYSEKINDSNR